MTASATSAASTSYGSFGAGTDAKETPMIDAERCECCGSDGILNRDLPPEKQAPIWTEVTFYGLDSGLRYFLKQVCSECNNRWQRMLLADIKAVEGD